MKTAFETQQRKRGFPRLMLVMLVMLLAITLGADTASAREHGGGRVERDGAVRLHAGRCQPPRVDQQMSTMWSVKLVPKPGSTKMSARCCGVFPLRLR